MRRVRVLLNPQAGSADRIGEARRALMDARSRFESLEIVETDSADDARRRARASVADGVDVVVAAGGDGAINSVVSGLMEVHEARLDAPASGARVSPLPALAALPLGTGNDFARTLAVGPDPKEAVAALVAHDAHRFDVVRARVEREEGSAERLWFINAATGGNAGDVADSLTDQLKDRWGAWCYMRGAFDVLSELKNYRLHLRWDGATESEPCDTYNILLANGRTAAGGVRIAWPANPEDGLLDVVLVKYGEASDVAAITASLVLGDYLEHENVIYRRAERLSVHAEQELTFSADGELIHGLDFTFEVVPGVLPVLVGADYVRQPQTRKQAV